MGTETLVKLEEYILCQSVCGEDLFLGEQRPSLTPTLPLALRVAQQQMLPRKEVLDLVGNWE